MSYPDKLYVTFENEGTDDEYINASNKLEELATLDKETIAAVYELKQTVVIDAPVRVRPAEKG